MPIKARLVFDSFSVCFIASFAKESTFSFPSISVWPGALLQVTRRILEFFHLSSNRQ